MARSKLERFAAVKAFSHVFEDPKGKKGTWHTYFGNNHPLILELGCGKGAYTVGLAAKYPDINVIGVDIQGERIWYGAIQALEQPLPNAAFIRGYVDHIEEYFAKDEVAEIWLTFPDPQPRAKKAKKRLTSPRFLERYKHILKRGGKLHLKTDNLNLFQYSQKTIVSSGGEIIEMHDPIAYDALPQESDLHIETPFEKKFRSIHQPIYYLHSTFS